MLVLPLLVAAALIQFADAARYYSSRGNGFFPASAEADKTITVCDEKTVVSVHESYSNAYNSLDGKNVLAADGINVIVRPSDWLEFDVMVEEAGYYQVDFKGA